MARILLIGYGNPGRLDDGLGPALAEEIEKLRLPEVCVESGYQLTVEDSHLVAQHEAVIFCDAAIGGEAPFFLRRLEASYDPSFTSHYLDAASVLGLARNLFKVSPPGWLLGIPGYAFNEFGEGLSPAAQVNLRAAVAFLAGVLASGDLAGLDARATPGSVPGLARPYSLAAAPAQSLL